MKEILDRIVSEYMQDVLLFNNTTSISYASKLMSEKGEDDVIVMKDNKAMGIVTHQDILDRVVEKGLGPVGSSMELIMSSPLVTVEPRTSVKVALNKMREQH